MSYITDLQHFLADDGSIAPDRGPARTMATFCAGIVAWVTSGAGEDVEDERTNLFCPQLSDPGCRGMISASEALPGEIHWWCPGCGEEGIIKGWEDTEWDYFFGVSDELPPEVLKTIADLPSMEKTLREISRLARDPEIDGPEELFSLLTADLDEEDEGEALERGLLDQAQDLVYQAWETESDRAAQRLAEEALDLSPDCADAYLILAGCERSARARMELVEQAVEAGKRGLGPRYFSEEPGRFWGLIETRPYMRALHGLVLLRWEKGLRKQAIDQCREMLHLNPNDNQGIRYLLAYYLLKTGELPELLGLLDDFADDDSAEFMYTRALVAYEEDGESDRANAALAAALASNRHVPGYLLGKRKLPKEMPDMYEPGGESEAGMYAMEAKSIWMKFHGALRWLKHQAEAQPF